MSLRGLPALRLPPPRSAKANSDTSQRTAGMARRALPPWLDAARADAHLTAVLDGLAARDEQRTAATAFAARRAGPGAGPYAVSAALAPQNARKNRYADVVPFDRTRVLVPAPEPGAPPRYLNASWVRELAGAKFWIASQAPLPHTAHAFLTLTLHPPPPPPAAAAPLAAPRVIVQLTANTEGGRVKAHPYFPAVVGAAHAVLDEPGGTAPPLRVTLLAQRALPAAAARASVLRVDAGPGTRGATVAHLLFTDWPDFGVPEDGRALLAFARLVDAVNRDPSSLHPELAALPSTASIAGADPNLDPPVIVGCSAGVGRTGTFVALCSMLRAHRFLAPRQPTTESFLPSRLPDSPLGPLPQPLDTDLIAREIDALRDQRGRMVQTDGQAMLIYDTLVQAFEDAHE